MVERIYAIGLITVDGSCCGLMSARWVSTGVILGDSLVSVWFAYILGYVNIDFTHPPPFEKGVLILPRSITLGAPVTTEER